MIVSRHLNDCFYRIVRTTGLESSRWLASKTYIDYVFQTDRLADIFCISLSLSSNWILQIIVLMYFVTFKHIIEHISYNMTR